MNGQIKKIALEGAVQVGKSTLVERLLKETIIPVSGFMTRLDRETTDADGLSPLYIYPAALPKGERVSSAKNLLGACNGKGGHKAYTEKFDTLATALLKDIPAGNLVVMDELGFLESGAENFKAAVRKILAGDLHVIMVIKNRADVQFLNELRALEGVAYYTVTRENRDSLFEELSQIVRQW